MLSVLHISLLERTSLMFSLVTSIVLCVLITKGASLSVQPISDGNIETFVEPVKLQGITFTKRYVNRSVSTTVKFKVITELAPDSLSFSWLFNGADLSVTRFKESATAPQGTVYSTEQKLTDSLEVSLHLKDKGLSPGNYTFLVTLTRGAITESAQASGFVKAAPILPLFPKDRRILEGDRLLISCEVTGYPKPTKVSWRFAPIKPDMMKDADALVDAKSDLAPLEQSNSSAYQFLTKTVQDDQLLFPQLPSRFNGLYECSVEEEGNKDESLILVNVKDRWAALWPFIGIVVEVAVLVTAILLYERHQMRSKRSKSDANAATTITTGPTTEAASPSLKSKATVQQQQQQNNVNAAGDPSVEVNVDGTKGTGTEEAGDAKQEELRLRSGVRC